MPVEQFLDMVIWQIILMGIAILIFPSLIGLLNRSLRDKLVESAILAFTLLLQGIKTLSPEVLRKFSARIAHIIVTFLNPVLAIQLEKMTKEIVNRMMEGRRRQREITVVEVMLRERMKKNTAIQACYIIGLVIYGRFVSAPLQLFDYSVALPILFSILLAANELNNYLIVYRIRKGWYGSNAFESREIINFIQSHRDKDDFQGPDGKPKKISPDEEVQQGVVVVPGKGVTNE